MAESQDQHQESADALKALAEGKTGDEPLIDVPNESLFEDAAEEFDPMSVIGQPLPPPAEGGAVDFADIETQSFSARRAAMQTRQQQAHAHQFKAFMIPLLLSVGAVLLICGVLSLVMAPSTDVTVGTDEGAWRLAPKHYHLLALCCFPVSAILLMGAWLFRRDVNKASST